MCVKSRGDTDEMRSEAAEYGAHDRLYRREIVVVVGTGVKGDLNGCTRALAGTAMLDVSELRP